MDRERLSEMIHYSSDTNLALVGGLVERLVNEQKSFDFPLDDEPTTVGDLQAIQNAYKDMKNNKLISFSDIENELRN